MNNVAVNANRKLLGMLGMAKKAGRLIIGTELVTTGIRNGIPKAVILARDASENTVKRVKNCCIHYKNECLTADITADELSHAIGKSGAVATVGITDKNFADAIIKIINGPLKDKNGSNCGRV